ncbi:MAG: glutathione S-transferase C-terminal domain-containing protein [Aeromicrobium sp.]
MTTFATPTDLAAHGEYTIERSADDPRPLYRFSGRMSRDGSTPFAAEPGRYHLYSGWFCPWAQRSVLVIELAGLTDAIGVSYVDNSRDARGWAFREANGPDQVNGFTLLRDAYERTQPGFDGHVSVPTLWDTHTGTIVTNDFGLLDIDLASQFDRDGIALYPDGLAEQIDELDAWILPEVNRGSGATLQDALGRLDERLGRSRYLLGDRLTLADVRLWVTLVRHDAAAARTGAPRLAEHAVLWSYARGLYALPAFTRTTDFDSFGGGAVKSDWEAS